MSEQKQSHEWEGEAAEGDGNGSNPMYLVISRRLEESIAGGLLEPGSRLPNGEDLARQYGTSVNTVTRAMRRLSDQGLIRRVPGLGTFVKSGSEERGAVLAFIGPCRRGLAEICALGLLETELRRRLAASGDTFRGAAWLDESDEQRTHEFLREVREDGGVQGVFFVPPEGGLPQTARCLEEMRRLGRAGTPVVLLDRDVVEPPDRSEFDVVSLDNRYAGFMLGRHLADQGARRVLFAAKAGVPAVVADRFEGMKAGLAAARQQERGEAADARLVLMSEEPVREVIKSYRPDAMVGKDDALAATLMQAAYDLHIRIPDEVMVAGFDDSPVAGDLVVPLTSVRQPIDQIVDAALGLMRLRLASRQVTTRAVSVRGSLVARRSTRVEG